MIGAIIGDIVGSIYEFDNIKTKNFKFFSDKCEFTDDSVLTIAIANAIVRKINEKVDFKQAVIEELKAAVAKHPYVMGGYGGSFLNWCLTNSNTPYNSCGNGSAMRVSACGFIANTLEEALNLAKISAEVTHNHPDGIAGAQAVAAAIFMARHGASKTEIREYIHNNFYQINHTLDEIRPNYQFIPICNGTIQPAIEAFLESTDFEDAIRNAISIGGDSDTIGAITGSIAEAFYGVPRELKIEAMGFLTSDLRRIVINFYKQIGDDVYE